MANTTESARFEAEHAARSFMGLKDDAKDHLRERIRAARQALDEADRRLDRNEWPNTCGILQMRAVEVEIALGRFAALHEAAPYVSHLARAAEVADGR